MAHDLLQLELLPVALGALQGNGGGGSSSTAAPEPDEGANVYVRLDFAVLESRVLSHCDKLVYCAVLSYAGWQTINPSESQIAARCNVSIRQVRLSLHTLQAAGILERNGRLFTFNDPATIAAIAAPTAETVKQETATNAEKAALTPTVRQPMPKKAAKDAASIDIPFIKDKTHSPNRVNGNAHLFSLEPPIPPPQTDPRHTQFKEYYLAKYRTARDLADDATVAWNAADARQLAKLLRENPSDPMESLIRWFDNFWNSPDTNRSDPPRFWLGKLLKYREGCLDRFGKPAIDSWGLRLGRNK
jgi:hypothetical protein